MQFEAYNSASEVRGHNACTVLSVILTDAIAQACERASYLWLCELYINEIWSYIVWIDHCTDPQHSARSTVSIAALYLSKQT